MGTYSLDVLIRKWGVGELTVEQAIGQILLMLLELANRLASLENKR